METRIRKRERQRGIQLPVEASSMCVHCITRSSININIDLRGIICFARTWLVNSIDKHAWITSHQIAFRLYEITTVFFRLARCSKLVDSIQPKVTSTFEFKRYVWIEQWLKWSFFITNIHYVWMDHKAVDFEGDHLKEHQLRSVCSNNAQIQQH